MKSSSSFDPNRELQRALANLETFAQRIENESYTDLSQFEVKEGKIVALSETALSKVIALAYQIVSPSAEEGKKVLDEVLESSNVVRNYFPFIQMLEDGNSEQQMFAEHVKGAIARFNNVIDKVLAQPPTLAGRIVHYFYEHSRQLMGTRLRKIDIPQKTSLKIEFQTVSKASAGQAFDINKKKISELQAPASQKIAILHDSIMSGSPVSKQTLELYAMKAISLLGQHAFLPHADASIIVSKTAKEMFIDRQKLQLTISQKLTPMPGQEFDISISFQADPLTSKYTIPVSHQITPIKIVQTGFPHPMQHNGWALADFLIPANLPRADGFYNLDLLLKAKHENAAKLLPQGEYAQKQRNALKFKRAIFKDNPTKFTQLSQKLVEAIVEAAPQHRQPKGFHELSMLFYATAKAAAHPYDYIADANQLVIECAICKPQNGLHKFWEKTLGNNSVIDIKAIKNVLQEEFDKGIAELKFQLQKSENTNEKILLQYCIAFATVLFEPASQIAEQQHLGMLKASPPILDAFTRKIQKALYVQAIEFQNELQGDFTRAEMEDRLKRLLNDDIAIFRGVRTAAGAGDAFSDGILDELNAYYESLAL